MYRILRTFILPVFLLCHVIPSTAEISLPAIISSHMVLQRNTTVTIWGWADAGAQISLETSWLDNIPDVMADSRGTWRFELETTGNQDPQTIRIEGNDSDILLEDILFGEVWLCSGQSNMEQPVKGYDGQPTFEGLHATSRAGNPDLRLFTVHKMGSGTPLKDVKEYIGWEAARPENVKDFSAVAYFFGQQLQEILGVPVGLIHTSWGGSFVEAWISSEVLGAYQDIDIGGADLSRSNRVQTALFNAMIHPLIPYSIKGALWYQGEGNRREPKQYTTLFPAMVEDWRSRWGIGEFPFYYVQIAPFWYHNHDAFTAPENSAFLRESQLKCLDLIPNSGMAVTMDIGDEYCIHPPKKRQVADRLLYNALNRTYGFSSVDCTSPSYESHETKNGGIVLSFAHAEAGVYAYEGLEGFLIAGDDRVFYPAEAEIIDRKQVFVKSSQVADPVAVRYCWSNWATGTLYDTNLLPASSFRTDDWEDATKAVAAE